jgi:hypothetical protein
MWMVALLETAFEQTTKLRNVGEANSRDDGDEVFLFVFFFFRSILLLRQNGADASGRCGRLVDVIVPEDDLGNERNGRQRH